MCQIFYFFLDNERTFLNIELCYRGEEAHHSGKSRGSNNYPDPPSSKP
jgi:hypothetical protein